MVDVNTGELAICGIKSSTAHIKKAFSFAELERDSVAADFLAHRIKVIQGEDRKAAAANTITYIALATAGLYYFSLKNKVFPSFIWGDSMIGESMERPLTLSVFLQDLEFSRVEITEEVSLSIAGKLFHSQQRVLHTLSALSSLPFNQCWALYDHGFLSASSLFRLTLHERARVEEGRLALKRLPPEIFGSVRNPFDVKRRYVDSWWKPVEKLPLKATCCLMYKTGRRKEYCYTCPKLTKQEREKAASSFQQQYGVRKPW